MSRIELCPRCHKKQVDTSEEILCDSCADIMAQDEIPDHDCHNDPDDGCQGCQEWADEHGWDVDEEGGITV